MYMGVYAYKNNFLIWQKELFIVNGSLLIERLLVVIRQDRYWLFVAHYSQNVDWLCVPGSRERLGVVLCAPLKGKSESGSLWPVTEED